MPPSQNKVIQRVTAQTGAIALTVLCVAVFLYQQSLSGDQLAVFLQTWGAVPEQIRQGQSLWTLVTSQFLHASWSHLFGNMFFLLAFGDSVEVAMGHAKFLVFYLVCGMVAGVTQAWLSPADIGVMIGASGAVYGVLGSYVALFPHGEDRFTFGEAPRRRRAPVWIGLAILFLLQFVFGIILLGPGTGTGAESVGYWAHAGGFVAGALLARLFRDPVATARQRAAVEADAARREAFPQQRTSIRSLRFAPESDAGLLLRLLAILFVVVVGGIGITVIWLRSR